MNSVIIDFNFFNQTGKTMQSKQLLETGIRVIAAFILISNLTTALGILVAMSQPAMREIGVRMQFFQIILILINITFSILVARYAAAIASFLTGKNTDE